MKFFSFIVPIFFIGCNILSTENLSNDFKYKKDRLNKTEILKFRYKPSIVNEIDDPSIFYDILDSKK